MEERQRNGGNRASEWHVGQRSAENGLHFDDAYTCNMCLFTGMAPDYLPRISSKSCGYPFTFLGGLYHSCVENMENLTSVCERWGCFEVNYTAAVCAANIGKHEPLNWQIKSLM